MSVEGMWCYVSGDVHSEVLASGGMVILDTNRVYGGDSVMAYVGKYEVKDGTVTAHVESWPYNPHFAHLPDVFGEEGEHVRQSTVTGALNQAGQLVGHLTRKGVSLPIVLQKMHDLP